MKKLIFRSVIVLCTFVLSGQVQLYAQMMQEHVGYSPLETHFESSIFGSGKASQSPLLQKWSYSNHDKNFVFNIAEVENEEEELISSKKDLSNSHYFTNFFYSHLPRSFFIFIKKSVPLRKYSSINLNFSSLGSLYVIFQVIII